MVAVVLSGERCVKPVICGSSLTPESASAEGGNCSITINAAQLPPQFGASNRLAKYREFSEKARVYAPLWIARTMVVLKF